MQEKKNTPAQKENFEKEKENLKRLLDKKI